MKPIIKVENLSKQYRIGARRTPNATLKESLAGAFRSPFKRREHDGAVADNHVWALNDVSFEIMPGETVGIIGRNGAGKSTLLKILSRTTEPTSGRVELYGRVGSLLEVGTGFHPELTGRENVYLNGSILGMSRKVIERKFDEIVSFAEVEKFIDTPVKHYSSGMYVRLAFAVAAHMDSEILIVDEALAVGDAAYQAKCLRKMEDVAKHGRTVLFVSHSVAALTYLCQKGMLFENGQLNMAGSMKAVEATYVAEGWVSKPETFWHDVNTAPGNQVARLRRVRVLNRHGQLAPQVNIDEPVFFEIEYYNLEEGARLTAGIHLYQVGGGCVLASDNYPLNSLGRDPWAYSPHPEGIYKSVCRIPENFLNDKQYTISAVVLRDGRIEAAVNEAVSFEVNDTSEARREFEKLEDFKGGWIGSVRVKLSWMTHEETEPTELPTLTGLSRQ
jgi:lipopolysaccharide transport system ATP-binding protein